jgi:Ca2+-binding RTX toxin-like protein
MKRRVALVLGIASLLVLAVAAVALAGTFVGTNKANTINGGANNDKIYGLNGNDILRGAAGNDYIESGTGADFSHGDAGNDQVYGGPGADDVFGDDGQDHVDGGYGNDSTINGGAGRDLVVSVDGIAGNDDLNGGADVDVCIFDAFGMNNDSFANCDNPIGVNTSNVGPNHP